MFIIKWAIKAKIMIVLDISREIVDNPKDGTTVVSERTKTF